MPHVKRDVMAQYVARVLAGERAVDVSRETQIPYSTLMRHVGKRRAAPPPSPSTSSAESPPPAAASAAGPYTHELEAQVVEWIETEQLDGRRVDKPRLLRKVGELLGWKQPASSGWYYRFRHHRRDVEGPASNLVVVVPREAQEQEKQRREAENKQQQQCEPETADNQEAEDTPVEEDAELVEEDAEPVEEDAEPMEDEDPVEEADADADLSCKVCAANSKAALDAVKVAVIALQAGYSGKLEPAELAAAFDVVVDPRLACAFTSMQVGPARDLWLQRHIRRLQRPDDDDPRRHE